MAISLRKNDDNHQEENTNLPSYTPIHHSDEIYPNRTDTKSVSVKSTKITKPISQEITQEITADKTAKTVNWKYLAIIIAGFLLFSIARLVEVSDIGTGFQSIVFNEWFPWLIQLSGVVCIAVSTLQTIKPYTRHSASKYLNLGFAAAIIIGIAAIMIGTLLEQEYRHWLIRQIPAQLLDFMGQCINASAVALICDRIYYKKG